MKFELKHIIYAIILAVIANIIAMIIYEKIKKK